MAESIVKMNGRFYFPLPTYLYGRISGRILKRRRRGTDEEKKSIHYFSSLAILQVRVWPAFVQAGQQITEFAQDISAGAALYDQDGKIIKRLGAGNMFPGSDT